MKRSLRNGKCRVVFGSSGKGKDRHMICTLNEELIPVRKRPKGTGSDEPAGVVRVFDTIIKDWRSFQVDSVKEFTSKVTPEDESKVRATLQE